MPPFDTTASAALSGGVVAPAYFIFLDVVGDPVRVTTYGANVTFASTGDADLDGNTFSAIDSRVVTVGDVVNSDTGSDTMTVDMSGIVTIDTTFLNEIGDVSKWRGRTARIWVQIYDGSLTVQGAVAPVYTGYMSSVEILPSPETQVIRLNIENYLAAFNQASNRSYLNQADYDAADTSAAATIAAANGALRGTSVADGSSPTSGGSGRLNASGHVSSE